MWQISFILSFFFVRSDTVAFYVHTRIPLCVLILINICVTLAFLLLRIIFTVSLVKHVSFKISVNSSFVSMLRVEFLDHIIVLLCVLEELHCCFL